MFDDITICYYNRKKTKIIYEQEFDSDLCSLEFVSIVFKKLEYYNLIMVLIPKLVLFGSVSVPDKNQ
jgi:hypothetical protein